VTQGQSAVTTELKQRGLGYAIKVNAAAFKSNQFHKRYTYFHFDLHAGSGYNEKADCIGSPLTFVECMESLGIKNYHAGFCDREHSAVTELIERLGDNRNCFVHHGDNASYISMIPAIIQEYGDRPEFAMGSVLCDPNGCNIPISELSWLNLVCPKIDVIVHYNATQSKREAHGVKADTPKLFDVVEGIGKKHWLIRQPSGIHQFTLLIGRNHRFGDYKSQGFYHLDSSAGQDIARRCHLSKDQYMSESGQIGMPI